MIYCVSEVIEMGIKCYLNQEKGVFHNMKRWRKISQVRWLLSCALVECTRPKIGTLCPLQHSCLENPMDGGAWWAAVHGVARVGHD